MKKCFMTILAVSLIFSLFTGCAQSVSQDTPSEAPPVTQVDTPPVTTQPDPVDATEPVVEDSDMGSDFDSNQMISVVSREDGSGTRTAFIELFGVLEAADDGSETDRTTREAIIADKTDVMMTNVANNPYAIGYISLGSMNDTIKALNIDGISAETENVKNGTYAIQRPFNIATKAGISELAQDFTDYILSAQGQAVIVENQYIAIDEAAPDYAGTGLTGKIVVAGSSSVTPVMEKLREAYLALNPEAEIEIQMSDSSAGMTSALEGTCDIGMASRALKDSELAELSEIPIAIDGIAVIVNNENPHDDMTSEQVKAVFVGDTAEWIGLGQ